MSPSPEERALIDKSSWGDGPWQHEPDELVWSFGDVECRLVRHPTSGHLNGYVGIPPSHPWHGRDWDNTIDADVNGGITFYGQFAANTFATPTNKHLWYIGFDCHHAYDLAPGHNARYRAQGRHDRIEWDQTYRTIEWVQRETESLARQAIQALRPVQENA